MVYPSMLSSAKTDHVINVRITHKTAHVPLMESVAFKEKQQALAEIRSMVNVEECLILQTCNRIELFIVTEAAEETVAAVKTYLANRAAEKVEEATIAIETSTDNDAFNHLLRVTLAESMVIGEDQALNQVWDVIWKRKTPNHGTNLKAPLQSCHDCCRRLQRNRHQQRRFHRVPPLN
jgi:glutamyl-tRNA reductase